MQTKVSLNCNQICVKCFSVVAPAHVAFSRTGSLRVLFILRPKKLCCQLVCLEYVLVFLSFFFFLTASWVCAPRSTGWRVYFHLWDRLQPTISIRDKCSLENNFCVSCLHIHIISLIHLLSTAKPKVYIQDLIAVLLSAIPAKLGVYFCMAMTRDI